MALVKCPNCGGNVSTTVDTCIHCGKQLTACSECGTLLAEQALFCPECGAHVKNDEGENTPSELDNVADGDIQNDASTEEVETSHIPSFDNMPRDEQRKVIREYLNKTVISGEECDNKWRKSKYSVPGKILSVFGVLVHLSALIPIAVCVILLILEMLNGDIFSDDIHTFIYSAVRIMVPLFICLGINTLGIMPFHAFVVHLTDMINAKNLLKFCSVENIDIGKLSVSYFMEEGNDTTKYRMKFVKTLSTSFYCDYTNSKWTADTIFAIVKLIVKISLLPVALVSIILFFNVIITLSLPMPILIAVTCIIAAINFLPLFILFLVDVIVIKRIGYISDKAIAMCMTENDSIFYNLDTIKEILYKNIDQGNNV